MRSINRWIGKGLLIGFIAVLAACGGSPESGNGPAADPGTEPANPVSGGTLNVAYPANPATLDPHLTTNQATRDVSRNIFEQLLTLNKNYEVVPQLAESLDISDDGKTYTFHLRQGVPFHNGKEMKAEDVVASMDKWLSTSTQGQANLQGAKFKEVDPYTVELTLERPSLVGSYILADTAPFPGIMPKEVIESASAEGIKEYIGTGPYKLEEWKTDQYVHLTKFADYAAQEQESSGLSGKKNAYLDEIYFRYVTDESTRVAGIMTGEYDVAFGIPFDNANQIDATDGVSNYFSEGGIVTYVFNKKAGPFADQKLRQAFNTALSYDEALTAAYSDNRFYELDSSLALTSQTDWYSQAGSDRYNVNDLEKAKQLVAESGYNGEKVVILTTRDYPEQYNLAVVAQDVLKSIGVNAELDVYDWPTVQERRTDEHNFDLFAMTFATRATIHQYPFLESSANYPGWSNSPELDDLLAQIQAAPSIEEAKPLVDQLNEVNWDYLPIIKLGNIQNLIAVRDNVKGFEDLIGPILWNVTLEK
ncbi:peptide/nickel transport system substrate-binding protein [Paenibacillus sp. cl141a]|uniref:ABC transporter substrate-binding protein n=1 Tax=Paenibacillus sp. cl141a TaxID=1761877 RepID=UPI0008D7B182|nr:ABC transporter substrate-binding protein [Paenibacillus sp. cl141a]SEL71303.1 peptide/nickel transport system substrate-binding protein [Paenibacillus sp. cl141a]